MSLATQLPRGDPGIDSTAASPATLTTLIPVRLERLPWGRFHVLVVAALGVT